MVNDKMARDPGSDKILSLVVPTYNMEKYLPACLDSVTDELIGDSLEVIVVNDGSTDRSPDIIRQYEQKRPDLIKVIDKPNGHYGSCVNAGLAVATGKYFKILDADDWFGEDDKKRVRELEDGLKKSDEQIRELNESLAEDARKDAEAVWDEAAAKVKAQHPDFDDVVYEKFAPLLHEKTGNAQIRAAWEGEKDKSPANAYRFAKKVLEIIEFQRDPDAYKARLRREIETEKRKPETESVSEPTGKDGLDMLNSADIPIDPGRSVSFVDAVFK